MLNKPFYQSKTLWVQLLSVLSLFVPEVQLWISTNPVGATSVFAAVNTIIRFVTKGAIEPFKNSISNKTSLLAMGMLCMALASGVGLTSCSSLAGGSGVNVMTTADGCILAGRTETLDDGSTRDFYVGVCTDGRKVVQWSTKDLQGVPVDVRATYNQDGSYSLSYHTGAAWVEYDSKAGLVIGAPPVLVAGR